LSQIIVKNPVNLMKKCQCKGKCMKGTIIFCITILSLFNTANSAFSADEIVKWLDCVSVAREKRPELQSALEKINQMKASSKITRSNYLPQIEADASASKEKNTYRNPNGGKSNDKTNNYSYGLSGKQLLFDGMKNLYDIKSINKQAENLIYDYSVQSSNIRLSLRNAYIQLMGAQESIKLTKDILNIRKQNLDLVKMRHDAGREHKGSLLTAEANLSQAKLDFLQATRNVVLAQKQLNKEMGISEYKRIAVEVDFTVKTDRSEPDFISLSKTNPLLLEMIALMQSKQYNLKSAKADLFPKVYATANITKSDTKFPPEGTNLSIGAQMALPLFQGGSSYYQISKAESAYKQLNSDVMSTKNNLLITMEQTWINLQNMIDQVDVQYKFLKAAEERAKIAEGQYSIGVIGFDNWTIIEDNLVSTKKSYLNVLTAALQAEASWIQAKGETLDYEQ
jgi:outer membrane protein TolC